MQMARELGGSYHLVENGGNPSALISPIGGDMLDNSHYY